MITKNNIQILLSAILILFVVSCRPTLHIADINEDRYDVGPEHGMPEDQTVVDIIAPYKIQLDSSMNVIIGQNAQKMEKRRPEGRLGNWIADIIYIEASKKYNGKIDFAVQNYGGLRVPYLDAGPITVREMYEVMPFDNELVVLTVKGVVIKALFERIAEKGGWPVSHQIEFIGNKIDGSIVSLKINGKDFDPTFDYTFALPDYVANGGDRCDFLINQEQTKLGVRIRDVLISHLQNKPAGIAEVVKLDGRMKLIR